MNEILRCIEGLTSFGSAFADVRIQQDANMSLKGPMGWMDVESSMVTEASIRAFLRDVEPEWETILAREKQMDRAISLLDQHRLRINAYSQNCGKTLGMVIRRQDVHPIQLAEAGLPIQVGNMATERSGLILVNGPTGSGKSTTLASIIDHINRHRAAHIVTIEQPIEYIHVPVNSMITQREVGMDTNSFSDGVHAALRQAPDVIMVGEVRDRDTCEAVLRAAMSGHLVLASTHGNRAFGAVQRMFGFMPEEPGFVTMALQSSLIGSVSQMLLPSIDGASFVVGAEVLNGRDRLVQAAIAEFRNIEPMEQALLNGTVSGSNHFNAHLKQLVERKKVTPQVAIAASPLPSEIAKVLQR